MNASKSYRRRLRLGLALKRRGLERVGDALYNWHHWWAWGRPVMSLVGRHDTGSYDPPRKRDLYYRPEGRGFRTTTDYADVAAENDGEWRTFDSQDDGHTIVIGYYPAPGEGNIRPGSLDSRAEQRLFLRWMLWDGAAKAEWFGLRRWVYFKALRSSLYGKKPFSCQAVPTSDSGGYDHWNCKESKGHPLPHRFVNYTWFPGEQVEYDPIESATTP